MLEFLFRGVEEHGPEAILTYTDFTGNAGGQPVEDAAGVIVRLATVATVATIGPTGTFHENTGKRSW